MLRALDLAARPLLVRPLRPLLERLPLAVAQSRMPKGSAFDLSRPIMGPRPKRPWKRYGFTMDVDYPAVTALLKERDAAQPEARRTGDYSVVDSLREYARRWQTWPPRPVEASARSRHTASPRASAGDTAHAPVSPEAPPASPLQAARQRALRELARRPAVLVRGAGPSALVRRGRQAAHLRDAAPDDAGARHRAEGGARAAKAARGRE